MGRRESSVTKKVSQVPSWFQFYVCCFPINILRRNIVLVRIFIYFLISSLFLHHIWNRVSREQMHLSIGLCAEIKNHEHEMLPWSFSVLQKIKYIHSMFLTCWCIILITYHMHLHFLSITHASSLHPST